MKAVISLAIISLFLPIQVFASAKNAEKALSELKNELSVTRNKIQQMKSTLFSIEQEIGGKNNIYLENIKQLDQLSDTKKSIEDELSQHNNKYIEQQAQFNKMLSTFVLRGLDDADSKNLLERVAIKTRMRELDSKLKESKITILDMQTQLSDLQQKITSIQSNEQEMASLIAELENKKQNFFQEYSTTIEHKNQLDTRFESLQLELKGKALVTNEEVAVAFSFMPPLKDYIDLRKDQKGVNFYYRETVNLHSPEKGEVAYVGDLGAYGTVVMIDHGRDIRSVLLGKIKYKVKKGSRVERGEVVGYVTSENSEKHNLYFEVRKNNKAQNSYAWLDKKLLINNL
jgi:septal ring factor EnvC (AmiA/AmiB activator)